MYEAKFFSFFVKAQTTHTCYKFCAQTGKLKFDGIGNASISQKAPLILTAVLYLPLLENARAWQKGDDKRLTKR